MAKAWLKIKQLMDNSVFFRLIERLMAFFARFFGGSVFIRGLRDNGSEGFVKRSFVYKALNFIFTLPEKARDKFFARMWNGSRAVIFLRALPSHVLSLSLRHAGFGVLTGCAVYLALKPEKADFGLLYIITVCAGFVCLFVKTAIYSLVKNGAIMRFITYLFGVSLPEPALAKPYPALACAYGAAAGFAFAFAPPVYAAAAVLSLPLVYVAAAYPFIAAAGVIFLMPFIPTMLIAAAIIGVQGLFALKLLTDKNYAFKLDLIGVFITIFIIITLFKGATSLHAASSVNIALLTSLFMSVYFPIVSMANTRRKIEFLILVFVFSALITGGVGFLQELSGQRVTTWVDTKTFDDLGNRVFSVFGNPNVFGAYLLLAVPMAAAGFALSKRALLKLFYLGAAAVLLANLALTYSRGCYLAIALCVVVFTLFIEKRLIAFLSAGVFILPAVLPQSMLNRLLSIGNMEDSSSMYRMSIYQASTRILERFWYVGIGQGPDAFNRVFPLYAFNAVTAQHSHNLFLQVFIETGVFGFIAFIGIIYCFFKALYPAYAKTKVSGYRVLTAALMAMMCGFILQSVFDYTFYNYKIYMLFFAVTAIAGASANLADEIKN